MQIDRSENRIVLRGRLAASPAPSHSNHGVSYLLLPLTVRRLSGVEDRLNVVASEDQLEGLSLSPGDPLTVRGEVRTFNNRSGVGSRLIISVFARDLYQEEGRTKTAWSCPAPCASRPPSGLPLWAAPSAT